MGWVRLQLLMRPEHRKSDSVEAAAKAAAALGLEPSGQGQATFSARVDAANYRRLFGDDSTLRIPKELAEYVESITVAPKHEYF